MFLNLHVHNTYVIVLMVMIATVLKVKIYTQISPSPSMSEVMFMLVVNEARWSLFNLLDLKTCGHPCYLSIAKRKVISDVPVAMNESRYRYKDKAENIKPS